MIAWLLARQILILFLMMACGCAIVKCNLLKSENSKTLSVVTIYICLPCAIINAFQIEYSNEIRNGFLLALAVAAIIHIILLLLCAIIRNLSAVEKASLIYSNAGNLIIPLVTTVLGSEWVIYANAFVCVQRLMIWTYGQSLLQGKVDINWKKILTNINMLSMYIGLILFFTKMRLPQIISMTMNNLGALVGPLSMIMLGMLLASVQWKKILSRKRVYAIVFLKMLLLPGIILLFLKFSGLANLNPNGHTILLISLLAILAPSATLVTQMAQIYNNDAKYASAINVLTTLVCIITMPVMVMLYEL